MGSLVNEWPAKRAAGKIDGLGVARTTAWGACAGGSSEAVGGMGGAGGGSGPLNATFLMIVRRLSSAQLAENIIRLLLAHRRRRFFVQLE